jgi:hypothetical protein
MPTDRQQYCKKPGCGNRFTRPQGTRRVYCYQCRPEAPKVVQFPGEQFAQPIDAEEDGPLTKLTREALEEGGVLNTWQGAAAMALAKLIDTGKHGASGAAGTIKAHREAMGVALADSGEEADVISMIFADQA